MGDTWQGEGDRVAWRGSRVCSGETGSGRTQLPRLLGTLQGASPPTSAAGSRRAQNRRTQSSGPTHKSWLPALGTEQSDSSTQRLLAVFQVRGSARQRGQLSPEPREGAGCRLPGRVLSCPGSGCCPHHKLLSTPLKLAMAPCGP